MKKEQIQNRAKEFCDKKNVKIDWNEFKTSFQIVMELRNTGLIEVRNGKQMEDIVNIVQSFGDQFKSTVSSAGKEVRTAEEIVPQMKDSGYPFEVESYLDTFSSLMQSIGCEQGKRYVILRRV